MGQRLLLHIAQETGSLQMATLAEARTITLAAIMIHGLCRPQRGAGVASIAFQCTAA